MYQTNINNLPHSYIPANLFFKNFLKGELLVIMNVKYLNLISKLCVNL